MKRIVWLCLLLFGALGSLNAQTTYYSRASSAWNVSSTWSTVDYNSAINTGTFPVAGDIVNIGGGFTVSVTAAAACEIVTIDNVSGLTIGAANFTVNGSTTIGGGSSGTLSITSSSGTKIFVGLVTINSGAVWTNTIEGVTFRGGIINNGTFTAGTGVYTFNTNSQTLTGTFSMRSVSVAGATIVLTNNNTLTVSTALSGSGRLTQGPGAVLNIGGTSAITNMTATASGNTVNYTGAAQTVHSNAYVNLGLSGSGIKTLQAGTSSITGDFTLSGTVSTTGVTGLTIGGSVSIGSGTTFTMGAFSHSVGGNWTNNGTFTHSNSTLIFTGAAQSIGGIQSTNFNEVVLGGTGTKVFGIATFIAGNLSINSGVVADLGSITTHTANILILAGAIQPAGTWGSTGSVATNTNDTYFLNTSTGQITIAAGGLTYYSRAAGAWNSSLTWSTVGHGSVINTGTFPTAVDYAVIGGNFTVSVTADAASKSLSFDAGTSVTNTLTINSGTTLTVTEDIIIPQTITSGSNILDVGAGNLSAGNISFTNGSAGGTGHQMTISTGTAAINGDVSGTGTSSSIIFSNTGSLQVGGSLYAPANGTLTTVAGSTVEHNGAAQTVESHGYANLTLSGTGTKTLAATTTVHNLTIGDNATFAVGAVSLIVNGTTTVGGGSSGTLSITSATGTKTFTGLVTINSGATWSNTTENLTFSGGITNNGTFTAGTGTYLFNTNSQALTGTFSIPRVTVTGAAVVLTNNNTLTVNTALSGTGRLTQGVGAVLNIGGTSAITNMIATASGNTVNYLGAAQTVHNNAYVNLGLSGSGIKTLQAGTSSITGDFTLSGTVSTTGVTGLTIGGSVSIGSGTSFAAGEFSHNVGGDWTNDGIFTHSNSTITFTGAAQSIGGTQSSSFFEVVLGGTGTKIFDIATFMAGNFSINSGVAADLGSITTHTANALILGGALQPSTGTWGSTASAATNTIDTYFSSTSTGEIIITTGGYTYYSRVTGDWNSSSTWSTVGHGSATNTGTFPVAGDYVYIGGNFTVTVTADAACASLSFDPGTSVTNTLTVNSSTTLTVSEGVTIPQTITSGSNILDVGAGNLSASNISFTSGSAGGTGHQMTISTGTATMSGNVSGTGTSSSIIFSSTGLLQLGGSLFTSTNGTLITVAGSTVEYNGASQTVESHGYANLTLSGSGTKTMSTTTTTVGGDLAIGDNTTFMVGAVTLTVSGTTTVGGGSSGTLSITSATGVKTFTGLVTINSGATWSNTTEGFTFQGGITNNGTFTAGTGVYTFNANSQALTGTFGISSVTVTGATVVLTNNNTLTVSTALSGTGRLTQGSGAVLNIGGTSAITNMTATASGNTVNYTGASQTVHSNAYEHLGLSGSGTKTLQAGTSSITGNFTLSGTVSTTGVTSITIGGSINIGSGTSFTAGAFSHNVGGDWINDGTFTHSSNTITFTGATQSIGGTQSTSFFEVVLGGTDTKTLGIATFMAGNLSINSGVVADLGSITTHTANALVLGGVLQSSTGAWGSTASAATNTNDTYFLSTSIGEIIITTGGNTYYSRATGDWNSSSTWSTVGHGSATNTGTFPVAGDYVYIGGNFTVTVTADASCKSLSFDAGTSVTNTLTVNSGTTLTVSEGVTIPQTITSGSNILEVGAGNLSAGSISFTSGSAGGTGHQMTISTGTATVSGNVSGTGTSSTIVFSNTGLLQLSGSLYTPANGTLTTVAGSTVEYNGASQTVQDHSYANLTLSGSGNKSLTATTTIDDNLTIGDNTTFTVGAITLTVSGTTTVGGGSSGTLSITSATGTKTFTGLVTINSGATWTNTSEGVTFRGGIANNGTFTAGTGVHLFNTNSQSLTGTFSIPSVTVTGATVVLTNNNTLTVNTALSGTGRLTQGSGAVLNIGGASAITNMTAMASGNTVNYTGAAQTVHSNAYVNLGLSGGGIKTLQAGTSSITGDFTVSGTVSTTGVTGLTIGGSVSIGYGTSFTAGAFSHSVGGNWTNDGTFINTGSTVVFNGTTTQSIQGTSITTFNNININNTSAFVNVESNQNLQGILTLAASANFDADGSGDAAFFTLLSSNDSPAADASIAELPGTAQLIGNVTVQRYFRPADNFDRFISSPVSNASVAQLQAATPLGTFPITGGFSGTSFPCTGCNNDGHNLRYYREIVTGAINKGYTNWVTSSASTLVPGVGYDAFMWNGVSNTSVSFRGTINRGSISLGTSGGITRTNNGVASADGMNLVGNPYPSAIQWNNGAGWNRTNIDPTVWVWDVVGRVWHTYNANTLVGDLTNGIIASGQGFWVLVPTVGAGSITINEQAKSIAGSGSYYRQANDNSFATLKVSLTHEEFTDNAFLFLDEVATDEFDSGLDAPKLELGIERLSVSFVDKKDNKLAHYALSQSPERDIPVSVSADTEGEYSLSFSAENGFEDFDNYYLIDSYLGTSSKISNGSYQFTISSNSETFTNRFRLSVSIVSQEESEFQIKLSCYPNPTSGGLTFEVNSENVQSILLLDNMGKVIRDISFQSHLGITRGEVDMMNYSNGVYFMKVVSNGKLMMEKIIKY